MRVIAIDPGTQCGYAFTDDGKVHVEQSGVWNLKPDRHSGGGMRYLRARKYLTELISGVDEVAVFYEEVRRHMGTDAAHVYGGIVGVITSLCEEQEIPYQAIPVGTIKKRATGKGNANKQAMIEAACNTFMSGNEAISELHPFPIKDDNQADALWILQCGIDELREG